MIRAARHIVLLLAIPIAALANTPWFVDCRKAECGSCRSGSCEPTVEIYQSGIDFDATENAHGPGEKDCEGRIIVSYGGGGYGAQRSTPGVTANNYSRSNLLAYRFSTKPLDFTTGLYYHGYHWYGPLTGRWFNRDPIGEQGLLGGYRLYLSYKKPGNVEIIGHKRSYSTVREHGTRHRAVYANWWSAMAERLTPFDHCYCSKRCAGLAENVIRSGKNLIK